MRACLSDKDFQVQAGPEQTWHAQEAGHVVKRQLDVTIRCIQIEANLGAADTLNGDKAAAAAACGKARPSMGQQAWQHPRHDLHRAPVQM